MTDDERPIFERGDVVYGGDPFKGEEDARPWLIDAMIDNGWYCAPNVYTKIVQTIEDISE